MVASSLFCVACFFYLFVFDIAFNIIKKFLFCFSLGAFGGPPLLKDMAFFNYHSHYIMGCIV